MLAFSHIHSYASPNLSFVVFISLVGILLLMFSGILTIHVSRDHIHMCPETFWKNEYGREIPFYDSDY